MLPGMAAGGKRRLLTDKAQHGEDPRGWTPLPTALPLATTSEHLNTEFYIPCMAFCYDRQPLAIGHLPISP